MAEKKVFKLRAPDNVKGTNWRERFYNEQVGVVDRVATVRRPGNRDDLLRRGWIEVVTGKKEKKEEKSADGKGKKEKPEKKAEKKAEKTEEAKDKKED